MDPSSLKMKGVASGSGTGGSPMSSDDEVVEIPPPPSSNTSNQNLKQKQVMSPEVIDLDYDEDLKLFEDNFPHSSKGKGSQNSFFSGHNDGVNLSKEECAMLQAHFDSVDVPTGIEAHVPWWPSSEAIKHQDVPLSSSFIDAGTVKDPQFSEAYNYEDSLQRNRSPSYAQQDSNPSSVYSAMQLPEMSFPLQMGSAASFPILPPIVDPGGASNFIDSGRLNRGIVTEISGPADLVSSHEQGESEALILKKLESFKQFDIVLDCSDHHYSSTEKPMVPNAWIKRIQDEWRMLEKDLPDTILVRVYEDRMDLLRAVIIGAEGTPYHDSIFFFDVQFPYTYPSTPPNVFYRSGGLLINPNLLSNGNVCLSLLNTWPGEEVNEIWLSGLSTILQVLVSLQGLVLNAEPFYNDEANLCFKGSAIGEGQSVAYNENAFLLSLKTMLLSMRRPPKDFEDFVFGHFCMRAHKILIACKSYLDGAQIGTLVNGGIQDLDVGDKSCSNMFKMFLAGYVNTLVRAFTKIGVKDCEKYTVSDPIYDPPPLLE